MTSKKFKVKPISELRQDPVFGDWVLLAPLRGKRHEFKGRVKVKLPKNKCPFDNLSKFGNLPPVLVYPAKRGWFLQVIPNKYPAVGHGECSLIFKNGIYKSRLGVGFHEIVILRDHDRYLAQYSVLEIKKILMAYRERYLSLTKDKCVKYISIFHNHGKEAGSTVPHLHSQILALPIVPPDVSHSINGSRRYYHEYKKCIHCEMLRQEAKDKKRIIYENNDAIVVIPFASKVNFETRIFPKKHSAYFERMSDSELLSFADAMRFVFFGLYKKLKDPAFNFFIHTAPSGKNHDYNHYHWHMEILPKFETTGSVELGTGLSIISITPEEAAKILSK
ncbi:MAG: HIT domain-containing protein [Parcubacteria group bacterium]|nr:HIT domain-containing protein [Parcubacteria group bacterium]